MRSVSQAIPSHVLFKKTLILWVACNQTQYAYPAKTRQRGDGRIEWRGVTSVYDNMNSHQNTALSRVWLSRRGCASHQPPPPAVLTDYYYGNPLAYACKMAMCETGKFAALLRTSCPLLDFLVWWKDINVIGLCHNSAGIEHCHVT